MAKKTVKTKVETTPVVEAVEKEVVEKETVKAAKKPAKKQEVYIQFGENSYLEKDIMDKVKKAWTGSGKKVSDMIDVKVYIKPEEAKAYYVINEDCTGCVEL